MCNIILVSHFSRISSPDRFPIDRGQERRFLDWVEVYSALCAANDSVKNSVYEGTWKCTPGSLAITVSSVKKGTTKSPIMKPM